MFTIVTNESNLFQIVLILRWRKIDLAKFFRGMFFRIFYGFNIGYPIDIDVSFKLAEIFDSSKPGKSASLTLCIDSLTKSFAIL